MRFNAGICARGAHTLLLFACREGGLGPPSLRGVLTEGTGMLPTEELVRKAATLVLLDEHAR